MVSLLSWRDLKDNDRRNFCPNSLMDEDLTGGCVVKASRMLEPEVEGRETVFGLFWREVQRSEWCV